MRGLEIRLKVRLNIKSQLIKTALKFTESPDHVSKDYGQINKTRQVELDDVVLGYVYNAHHTCA